MSDTHFSTSAPMMIEQALEAYADLVEAELTYAGRARHAIQALSQEAISEAMVARARWRDATMATVLATDRLGDSDVCPEDLPLGHAIVDCWTPNAIPGPKTPGENDLGATAEGTLWIVRNGHLICRDGHKRISAEEFRERGGILMRHQHRWIMVEEALRSRFPYGTQVENSHKGKTALVRSPGDDVPPWRANHYFPDGSVYTDQGWWAARFLQPV